MILKVLFQKVFLPIQAMVLNVVMKIAIKMTEIKDRHQKMLTKLLQYHIIFQKKKYKCPTPNCAATSKYTQNVTKHVDLCYNVNKKKTENQNSKIYCRIENFHGTASSNEILMEDEGQEEEVPEKDQ